MIKTILVKFLNATLGPATRLAETALRHLRRLPPDAPVRMTPTQLSWDDYLRRRDGTAARDFSTLHAPGVPGLVSIILPVHNGERYLSEALDSILAQNYRQFELIVVDDGSTDRTPEIIAAAAAGDSRIRPLRQQNARLPGALNAGFRLARGEFFTWTSDDNRLRPDFLEKMVAVLQADPRADMIFADYDLIDEKGDLLTGSSVCTRLQEPPGSGHVHLLHDLSILNLINGNFIGGAFLYRARAHYLLGEYSPHRFTCEDYDFWLRVNEQLCLRHAPFRDIVYEYRIHGTSLTARKDELAIDRRTEALMAFDDFRRDFTAHPILWTIQCAHSADAGVLSLAQSLDGQVRRAGHLLVPVGRRPGSTTLPPAGLPAAVLFLTNDLADLPAPPSAESLPPGALRILIHTGAGPLPERVDPGWDLCIAIPECGMRNAECGISKFSIHHSPFLIPHLNNPQSAIPHSAFRIPHLRQGWLVAGSLATLWDALCVRVQSDAAARLEDAAAQAAAVSARLQVSLIICTRLRPRTLGAAIRAACRQSASPSCYEVLVVNNAPARDDLRPLIAQIRRECCPDDLPRLRLVDCPPRGLSIARNAGLAAAQGEIVIFLDDDAIAAHDLLEKYLAAYASHPDCAVIGGAIELKDPSPRPAWFAPAARKYWSHFEPPSQEFTIAEDWRGFPWGANWSARRAALLAVGGFRCRYGRGGRQFETGEDVIAALLLQCLGHQVGIEPAARVMHDVDPARFTLRTLARTIFSTWELGLPLELDFYLSRPAHWPRLLRLSAQHLRHAAYALRRDRFEALENTLFAVAHVRLALRQIGLELRRWRRPRE